MTGTRPTSTTLSAIAAGTGQATLVATVSASGLLAPTGSVSFTDTTNRTSLGSATLTQSFAPAAAYGVGQFPEAVAVGDFNCDGVPDLASANHFDNTVAWDRLCGGWHTVPKHTPKGTYPVTFRAVSGALTHTATASFTVR